MDTICKLQVPDNFEELYRAYRKELEVAQTPMADAIPKESIVSVGGAAIMSKQTKSDAIFPVPVGTAWHELVLKFKDGETIEAFKGKKDLGDADFRKMGFGKRKPNQQWQFLQRLAMIYATNPGKENDMPTTIDDLAQSLLEGVSEAQRRHIQTLKNGLAVQLRKDFGIEDDPFEDYDQWRFYKAKFKLQPEPGLRRERPYEAAAQMHENIEKMGEKNVRSVGTESRVLSDEDDQDNPDARFEDDFTSSDDGGF